MRCMIGILVQKGLLNHYSQDLKKLKILGVRSEMLANGAPALINVPKGISSTYEISE